MVRNREEMVRGTLCPIRLEFSYLYVITLEKNYVELICFSLPFHDLRALRSTIRDEQYVLLTVHQLHVCARARVYVRLSILSDKCDTYNPVPKTV